MCKQEIIEKKEFLINDQVVDVTNFSKRHPGGGIIRFMIGSEATDSYNAFHTRSSRAQNMLNLLPSRKATEQDLKKFRVDKSEAMLKDFEAFRQQLKEEGYYNPSYTHIAYRIAELVAMHYVGGYMLLHYWESNPLLSFLGLLILGIGQGRCGWFMHEGGHGSLTGNLNIDWNIQRFFYGFGCGMSARWWRIQHNKHHATPQKLKHDADLDTLPLIAFCKETAQKASNGLAKFMVQYQALLWFPMTCLLVATGWTTFLHPRCIIRKQEWLEAFWIGCRYATVGYLSHNYLGWGMGILCYFFYVWVGSTYIFTNFAVSHTHLPVVQKDEHVNWVTYASKHTMNVSHNAFVNWWMAYLNFQIEHHLFPSMPQYRFPQIAPRVKKLLEKHGYPYLYTSYMQAMKITFSNLDSVAHIIG